MSSDTAVLPQEQRRKMSLEWLNCYRDAIKRWGMKMPEGTRFLLLTLLDLSWMDDDPLSVRRRTEATPKKLATMTDCSVRAVGRRLAWLELNGFITTLKAPARGNGATGRWQLNEISIKELEESGFRDTVERIIQTKRFTERRAVAEPFGGTAVTNGGTAARNGGTASTETAVPPQETAVPPQETAVPPLPTRLPYSSLPEVSPSPAPPAVPPFGRGPVPGSSGPRPGLPTPVADEVDGEPQRVDEGQQPQDVRARDARDERPPAPRAAADERPPELPGVEEMRKAREAAVIQERLRAISDEEWESWPTAPPHSRTEPSLM